MKRKAAGAEEVEILERGKDRDEREIRTGRWGVEGRERKRERERARESEREKESESVKECV